jgi:SAM-dependent methyltransferase
MADAIFETSRLAEIYDRLEPSRPDLNAYVAMVAEFDARSVLDIGCGTGTFACLLAQEGIEVTGLDPAGASLAVAARKPFSGRVTWVHGDAATLPSSPCDLVTMTGNVAQVFLTDAEWTRVLAQMLVVLRVGGRIAFEVRDPARRAWEEWDRARTYHRVALPGRETVATWVDLISVDLPLVSFRHTFVFEADGSVLTSESTLRFRSHDEIERSLRGAGLVVEDVRDAPDRPGLELVFIARRAV